MNVMLQKPSISVHIRHGGFTSLLTGEHLWGVGVGVGGGGVESENMHYID
jgi:hypothetical protein